MGQSLIRRARAATAALALALLVVGCGDDADQSSTATGDTTTMVTSSNEATGEGGEAEATESAEATTRTVEDALGTVEIPANAERIIPLDGVYAAYMISLGVQPAAVPNDVKLQFSALVDWMPDGAEIAQLEEFGESYPLNLEALALQEPDLIIAGDWETDYYGEPFMDIAPVYSTLWSHNGDWRARFLRVAEALGRTDEARAVSDDFDALVASLPTEVTEQTIAFVRADALDNIRADTLETSFPASVAREAGIPVLDLTVEVDLEPEANWIDLSPERLDLLAGADLIVISDLSFYDPESQSTDIVLAGSPLWENLPAVQAGKVVLVPGPVYNGGSYQAASALITEIAEAVAGD